MIEIRQNYEDIHLLFKWCNSGHLKLIPVQCFLLYMYK